MTPLIKVLNKAGNPSFVFYEDHLQLMVCLAFIMLWLEQLKIFFVDINTERISSLQKSRVGYPWLPVELGVEKELGITKDDIGKSISVEKYNSACKKAVMKYTDVWNDLTERIGYWVDLESPYITYTSKYMESVWWLLKQIYNKGLLYKGYTIQPYSPMAVRG